MTQIGSYQCELEPAVAAEEAFESRKDGRDKKEGWNAGRRRIKYQRMGLDNQLSSVPHPKGRVLPTLCLL